MPRRESLAVRWSRRVATFGLYGVLFVLGVVGLPLWIALAVGWDLAHRNNRLPVTRLLLFGVYFLACEWLGLAAAFGIWLTRGPWLGRDVADFEDANFRLQCVWARALLAGTRTLFQLRIEVEGEDQVGGPVPHVWVRHASIADTLLPAVLLGDRHGMRLRWVMKRELLADPCLDVVGQRLPNVFVDRGGSRSEREIAAIEALAATAPDDEGVLIYPEGTRFSAERRQRALARIAESGRSERLARVEKLSGLLPPRHGGALALLRARPEVDVLIMGHAGLDGLSHVRDVAEGALIGRRVSVRYWRFDAAELPDTDEERALWIDARWLELDRWLSARLAEDRGEG